MGHRASGTLLGPPSQKPGLEQAILSGRQGYLTEHEKNQLSCFVLNYLSGNII
jgi:hypothetical protein